MRPIATGKRTATPRPSYHPHAYTPLQNPIQNHVNLGNFFLSPLPAIDDTILFMARRQRDPSTTEIRRMCARIRSLWTAKEYEQRGPQMVARHWEVPEMHDGRGDAKSNGVSEDEEGTD